MATQYNKDAYYVTVVAFVPFDPVTGVESNMNDIIAATSEECSYIGGVLRINGEAVAEGDFVGVDNGSLPVRVSAAEIDAHYTEA